MLIDFREGKRGRETSTRQTDRQTDKYINQFPLAHTQAKD